jgi:hypothetical protein
MAKNEQTKHDYDSMYHEYITTDVSYRQLAERHGASFSAVSAYGRKHGWDEKRAQYKALENEKAIERLADKRAKKVAEIEAEAFDAIHMALLKFGISLEDRWETDPESGKRVFIPGQQVTPEGLTKLMDKYLVMTGNVTDRRANLGLNVSVDGGAGSGIPRDVLRQLRDLAVTKGAGERSMGQSPIPRLAGAKQVN